MQDTDLSWQVLRHIVHDWAGSQSELEEVRTLSGGYIATTVALQTKTGDRAVLKITPHRIDRSYADEMHQLAALRAAGVPVPEVYCCEVGSLDRPFSYLLMEFREGVDLARAKSACSAEQYDALQCELANIVREMHRRTNHCYCRLSVGDPKAFETWPLLYREMFDPIWLEAEKSGHLSPKCRKQVAKIHDRLPALLHQDDKPRLLHGDLWASNILAQPGPDGAWHISAILDPHCRYGHIEVELAYLELFHTVNGAFMRAYQGDCRLPSEYHTLRKPIYQLYELLNHLQLYGQEYLKPTIEAVERVSRVV